MEMSVKSIRDKLADAINRVAKDGERVVLTQKSKGVAAIVSMEDLAALQRLEDEADVKAARKARNMALSQHAANGTLGVFDATKFEAPKTKDAVALLEPWRSERPCLVVLAPAEDNAGLSFRNVDSTSVVSVDELEVADVLRARTLLVSKAALNTLSGGEAA